MRGEAASAVTSRDAALAGLRAELEAAQRARGHSSEEVAAVSLAPCREHVCAGMRAWTCGVCMPCMRSREERPLRKGLHA